MKLMLPQNEVLFLFVHCCYIWICSLKTCRAAVSVQDRDTIDGRKLLLKTISTCLLAHVIK